MVEHLPPALRTTPSDRAAQGLRGLVDFVNLVAPGWGSLFGELVGEVIPGQRQERMAEFLALVARRSRLTAEGLSELANRLARVEETAQRLALLEEGARAAVVSAETERRQHLAQLVAGGLVGEEMQAAQNRSLLRILNNLGVVEVEALRLIAVRCAEGRRGQPFAVGLENQLLNGAERDDPERFAGYLMIRAQLEAQRLIFVGNRNFLETYPTTLGEQLLLQAGLHPDMSQLYHLSKNGPPARPTAFHSKGGAGKPGGEG